MERTSSTARAAAERLTAAPSTLAPCILVALVAAIGCRPDPAPASDAGPDESDAAVAIDAGAEEPDAGPQEPDAGPGCQGPPGLYVEGSCDLLAPGVRPFEPRFVLWSDAADKDRFIYLPAGSQIETTDPDNWVFPVGTRLYKTFSLDGVRLETRLLEKTSSGTGIGAWTTHAYAWNASQDAVEDVTNASEAVRHDVLGTEHDIPSGSDCVRCHRGRDVVNGFSAIMLAHDGPGVTLRTLLDEPVEGGRRLTSPIALADAEVPGDPDAVAALGYLHANCGNCHREAVGDPAAVASGLFFWVDVGLPTVQDTATYRTAVGQPNRVFFGPADIRCRVHPGEPDLSSVVYRMNARGGEEQMPPLGSEHVDVDGLALVRTWVEEVVGSTTDCVP